MHADAGCNGMSAAYTFDGDKLVLDQLRAEGAPCSSEQLEAQEDWLVSLMHARPSVSVDDDGLTLSTDDTTVALVVGGVIDL